MPLILPCTRGRCHRSDHNVTSPISTVAVRTGRHSARILISTPRARHSARSRGPSWPLSPPPRAPADPRCGRTAGPLRPCYGRTAQRDGGRGPASWKGLSRFAGRGQSVNTAPADRARRNRYADSLRAKCYRPVKLIVELRSILVNAVLGWRRGSQPGRRRRRHPSGSGHDREGF